MNSISRHLFTIFFTYLLCLYLKKNFSVSFLFFCLLRQNLPVYLGCPEFTMSPRLASDLWQSSCPSPLSDKSPCLEKTYFSNREHIIVPVFIFLSLFLLCYTIFSALLPFSLFSISTLSISAFWCSIRTFTLSEINRLAYPPYIFISFYLPSVIFVPFTSLSAFLSKLSNF